MMPPDAYGTSHTGATGMRIVTEMLIGHNMLLPKFEIKAHLAVQGAVPLLNLPLWTTAWAKASPTTTGHDEGSKFWCVICNFLWAT